MNKEIKKIFSIISLCFILVGILGGVFYINHMGAEKVYIAARINIPEGVLINQKNYDLYFTQKNIPIKNTVEKNAIEYNNKNQLSFYNKRTKYLRKAGDLIWKDYVDIDMEKDYVKYKLAALSKKYGRKYVAKSVKLNPDEYFQAKGLVKGEDKVKIKFIKDIEKKQILVARYYGVPILDWSSKKRNVTNIVIAMPEIEASMFDLERLNNKKMIVEFEPFLANTYKSNDKSKIWLKDIDQEYKSGISYNIGSEEEVRLENN
jgi:hypothetical protein